MPSPFRSLKHPNYRRYFLGQIVSFTGSWMQSAALMWLLYDRTGDVRWPSYLLVAQVGPTLLLGTWAGHLADRLPKRDLIVRTQAAFLVNAVVLAVLVAGGWAAPLLVLALQLLNGIIQAIDLPTRLAFVPDLVPRADLINAVGLNAMLFNSGRAVGPAATGLLFLLASVVAPLVGHPDAVALGAVGCFTLNALSYLAVLLALRRIEVPGLPTDRPPPGSVWDGVRYLVGRRRLGGLVLLTFVLCAFAWPLLTLFPGYTRTQLGLAEESYSFLVSALGAGALVGALGCATYGTPARRGAFLVFGAAAAAAGLWGLAETTTAPAAVGWAGCVGFGLILFLSTGQSAVQLAVPDDVRGRVMAVWAMTLSASAPAGHLAAGQIADAAGVAPVLRGMALGCFLVSCALLAVLVRGFEPREGVKG
ncbi:MAG TPA: MFS transporter [Urbifossiella sp.]|nr:MFS transporter [Urbifossiella sp.]